MLYNGGQRGILTHGLAVSFAAPKPANKLPAAGAGAAVGAGAGVVVEGVVELREDYFIELEAEQRRSKVYSRRLTEETSGSSGFSRFFVQVETAESGWCRCRGGCCRLTWLSGFGRVGAVGIQLSTVNVCAFMAGGA